MVSQDVMLDAEMKRQGQGKNEASAASISALKSAGGDSVGNILYRKLGCLPREAEVKGGVKGFRDPLCVGAKGYSKEDPCSGGLPFFKIPVSIAVCDPQPVRTI